jgi:uncharacterized protein
LPNANAQIERATPSFHLFALHGDCGFDTRTSNGTFAVVTRDQIDDLNRRIDRLIELIERAVPPSAPGFQLSGADAFVWHADTGYAQPVAHVNRIDLQLLTGIDSVRDILLENTRRFAAGRAANNALLWGARGMGKSSLVKAVHHAVNTDASLPALKLIEINREDVGTLPALLNLLRGRSERVVLFCDDLSFDANDTSYKSLKAALEGGIEGRPGNVIFYATSNRRHLLPRDMIENERSTAISPAEAVEEKVSLSDRFGLWLGFHKCSQDEFLQMIEGYVSYYRLDCDAAALRSQALEWATTRGSRSGRVAWQFIQDLAGRLDR